MNVARKMLPLAAALTLAFAAVVWGLVVLMGIFADERAAAFASADREQRSLSRYAVAAVAARLSDAVTDARERLPSAANDPLRPSDDLLLIEAGNQRLPHWQRPPAPRPDDVEASRARRRLLTALSTSIADGEPTRVEDAARRWLAHRASERLALAHELEDAVAGARALIGRASPSAELARGLLRDGVDSAGSRAPSLLALIARARGRLSPVDVAAALDDLTALAARTGVDLQRAVEALKRPLGAKLAAFDLPTDEVSLVPGWGLAWRAGATIEGVRLVVDDHLTAVADAMRASDLLDPNGGVLTHDSGASIEPLSALGVSVSSPAITRRVDAARERFSVKRGLAVVCGIFALLAFGLALAYQWRRYRFVEMRNEFVSAVTHELKTPLAAIRAMGETLERRVGDVEGARDYPARIVAESERLGFLVDNILSYQRLERGRWTPRFTRMPLRDWVGWMNDELVSRSTTPASLHADVGELVIEADAQLVELLLSNLVQNALRYTTRRPVQITFRATKETSADAVVVSVGDNGPGLGDGHRALLEPFVRGDANNGTGTGLGLAICRRIMQVHKGQLRVGHTGQSGTTFELIFPSSPRPVS